MKKPQFKNRKEIEAHLAAASKNYKKYLKGKVAALSWNDIPGEGGAMNLHVKRDWTMKQITSYVEAEWRDWNKKPVTIETHEFGKTGNPLRKFLRNAKGKWTEVEAKTWPKEAVDGYHNFLERQCDVEFDAARKSRPG